MELDLLGDHTTLRLRAKADKLLAQLDLGNFTYGRPLSPLHDMVLRPYLLLATNRAFNKFIYGLGSFNYFDPSCFMNVG